MTYPSDRVVEAFYQASLFLIERIKKDRWVWSTNYVREHARCAMGEQFTNTESLEIMLLMCRRHPDVAAYFHTAKLKPRRR